jgi:hypothetical protein
MMNRETVRNMSSFIAKNKFEKLVQLVGIIIIIIIIIITIIMLFVQ